MKHPDIKTRPNVQSAWRTKKFTIGEKVDQLVDRGFKNGRFRKYVTDLCDFCLEVRYVNKMSLARRKILGLKFLCVDCVKKGVAKYGKGIIPCYTKGGLTSVAIYKKEKNKK